MLAYEVLDLVSDSDGDAGVDAATRPSHPSPPPPSTAPPPKRRKLHLTRPDASNTDDALSLISLSSDDTPTPLPHRRPHTTPSSDDEDEEADLSNEEADLTTSSVPSLALLSTPSALTADALTPSPAEGKKRRKKAVVRYFGGEDLSVKCWNCGVGGHESAECTKARTFPPCYICGQSLQSHEKWKPCPNELCFRCGGAGHQRSECKSARFVPRVCYRCGSTSHDHGHCHTPPSSGHWDLSAIHCFVCGGVGHLNCSPPSLSSTPLHCSNCASPYHSHANCRLEKMRTVVSIEDYSGTPGGSRGRQVTCFGCGELGHERRDCPESRFSNRGSGGTRIVGRSGGAGGMRLTVTRIRSSYDSRGGSGRDSGGDRHRRDRSSPSPSKSPRRNSHHRSASVGKKRKTR